METLLSVIVAVALLLFLTRKGFRKLVKPRKTENASSKT